MPSHQRARSLPLTLKEVPVEYPHHDARMGRGGIRTPAYRLVLLKLADCANDSGARSFPSIQTISCECELGRATVMRALKWLQAEGWIEQVAHARHHQSSEWKVCVTSEGVRYQNDTPSPETPEVSSCASEVSSCAPRGIIRANPTSICTTVIEPSVPVRAYDGGFNAFWAAYPRKVGRGAALLLWQHLKPDASLQARIQAALAQQRTSEQWLTEGGRFIPHPRTWLSQGRWDDEPVRVPHLNETTVQTLAAGERWLQRRKQRTPEALDVHKS